MLMRPTHSDDCEVLTMKRSLIHLLALLMLLLPVAAFAQTAQEPTIATVNGEPLPDSDYTAFVSTYAATMQTYGADLTDPATIAYIEDLALTTAIENMLVEQDMRAQDCYSFDEETETWLIEQGNAAYDAAFEDVRAMMRESLELEDETEITTAAQAYADELGVTRESYIDFYREQYATMNYYDWLTRDVPVTQEEVQAEYEARVASSQALYENDIAAFEMAVSRGGEVWFTPEGYRNVQQILLPAEGETDEEKLASVKTQLDEIQNRLSAGESFEALMKAYSTDATLAQGNALPAGYQVHRDSIVWEEAFVSAAFGEDMQKPGDVSAPFASTLGVHVLCYLSDVPSGSVSLTQEISDLLSYSIYESRCQKLLSARIDELSEAAEVIIH